MNACRRHVGVAGLAVPISVWAWVVFQMSAVVKTWPLNGRGPRGGTDWSPDRHGSIHCMV